MKLSLAIPSFEDSPSPEDLEGRLREIASWGYDAVEPMICRPDALDAKKIRGILNLCGLEVSGFRTGLAYLRDGLSFTDPDSSIRELAIRRISEDLDLTANFPGASLLNGLIQGPLRESVTVDRAKAWIEEALRRCCARAESLGVIFCLEPINRYELGYHNTLEDVSAMVDKVGSSNLRILIDTFHMNIEEVDICRSIREFGEYIGGVHLADSNRSAPGTGHLDFPEILDALEKVGYDGYLTIEMNPRSDFDGVAREAVRYLRDVVRFGRF
ncbi:MAG: TIM barrel protein [bacterium]